MGGALVAPIEARFPGTTSNGAVDRERLAAHVLNNRDELAALEMLVHPAVARRRADFIAAHADAHQHARLVAHEDRDRVEVLRQGGVGGGRGRGERCHGGVHC